jgi:PE family
MSYVIAAPEYVAAAAADLAHIGSAIGDANSAAATPISTVLPPGADEVSAGITALFSSHAQAYQALSAQVAMFHDQFVQLISAAGSQYATAEAANTAPLQAAGQGAMSGISAPSQALGGHPTTVSALPASAAAGAASKSSVTQQLTGHATPAPAAAGNGAATLPIGTALPRGLAVGGASAGTVASVSAGPAVSPEELGTESGALADSGETAELAAATPMVTQVAAAPAATAGSTATSVHPGPSGQQAESTGQRQPAASA